MLKALELVGFKSFADKTRFEFPAGITVVVGPNGSGKSNVVDAIKWVLGEQSAKSLRGREMADVIFKGSGNGTRRAANTAEATIIFENADRRLEVDATEVHVTRRVYRSGEGEYLINGQPCRLRDVKDLFRGTGVGTDAYSLIEQGKVDTLLQASPRDRRAIFEEAAGISRFKAKKVEAQRRLERVDQNLLRLTDIVEEVENRLRSVRAQASKARRYRDYTDRLQQLRTQVALADWRQLTSRLTAHQAELDRLRQQHAATSTDAEQLDARLLELDTEISLAGEQIRSSEAQLARKRELITGHESTRDHEYRRLEDLAGEASRHRHQLAVMNTRVGDLQAQLADTLAQLEQAEAQHTLVTSQLAAHEQAVNDLTSRFQALRAASESRREDHTRLLRRSAALGNQISAAESQQSSADAVTRRCQAQLEQLQLQSAQTQEHHQRLTLREQQLRDELTQKSADLEQARQALSDSRNGLVREQVQLVELQGEYAGATQRATVLEDLERRGESLGPGVRDVLERSRAERPGPFANVRGLLADLFQVDVDHAGLIDVALGDTAQYIVLEGAELLAQIEQDAYRPAGRVGLLPLVDPLPSPTGADCDLTGQPGVIGRADRFVQTPTCYGPLVQHLLGATWLVEDLATACRLKHQTPAGARFVTRAGEVLERDGTLVVGPRRLDTGLVARRSQLRALRQQIARLEVDLAHRQVAVAQLNEQIARQDQQTRQLAAQHEDLAAQVADQRAQAQAARDHGAHLRQQTETVRKELLDAQQQADTADRQLQAAREELNGLEQQIADLQCQLQADDQLLDQLDEGRHQHVHQATRAKVELATSQQRLETLRGERRRFQQDQQERDGARAETEQHLRQCLARQTQAQRTILQTTSTLAELYLAQQRSVDEIADKVARRAATQRQRVGLAEQLQQRRRQMHEQEELQHREELAASQLEHERQTLADRLREDYNVELVALELAQAEAHAGQRNDVDAEIADLRRKISNIGAVNMEALAELEELEARYQTLGRQLDDLVAAKEALERIIHKINADSRRLFSETFAAIRHNFLGLFRKVFGGGHADIVLEDGVDILESGIEIIATPPGKQSLSISLLSGGERALTAVTLLLAIFQYRPSPFCVLDEVDGPLDEANIGRFIDVMNGFLDSTKFVIVTHSKKTMTAAGTLYGVTMQESGVSKRVSVQFDDVSDDGQIRDEALARQTAETAEDSTERGAA